MLQKERIIYDPEDVAILKSLIKVEVIMLRVAQAKIGLYVAKGQDGSVEQVYQRVRRGEMIVMKQMNELRQNTWGGV